MTSEKYFQPAIAERRERLVEVMRATGCDKERLVAMVHRLPDNEIGQTHISGDDPPIQVLCAAESLRVAIASDMKMGTGESILEFLLPAKEKLLAQAKAGKWLPSKLLTREGAEQEMAAFVGGIEDPF